MLKNRALVSTFSAVAMMTAAAWPLASQAATLSAGVAVEIGVADTDFTSVLADLAASDAANTTDGASTGYVYGYSDDYTNGNYAYAAAVADQDGRMYSTAGGDNTFKSVSHVQQSLTITNDSGVDQSYSFDFTILAGSLDLWGAYDQFANDEVIAAGNLVSISLDGVELFASSALLVGDNAGISLQTTGVELGTYTAGSNYYTWGALSDTLDLGVFGAGDSFTLTYDIYTAAAGIHDGTAGGGFDGGDGCYLEEIESEGCYYDYASAYSQFGDPNGVSGSPIAGNVHGSPVSVPEPSLWLLMGTGLFGFAVARRRKDRNA